MIYLDNSATTRPFESVIACMTECMREGFANPSSLYGPAVKVERQMTAVRETLLAMNGCPGGRVIFTSGGTESNNLAIVGTASACRQKGHLVTTAMEHPSVLEVCRKLAGEGWELDILPVSHTGQVDEAALAACLREDTRLVSIMQVNNETGAWQDVARLAAIIHERAPQARFHVDGVQAFGRVPMQMQAWGVDLFTLSAHKIHGPKGVGALVCAPGVKLNPLVQGGGQEGQLRSGTENVPGILGLGCAAGEFRANRDVWTQQLRAMKRTLYEAVMASVPDVTLNGPAIEDGAPHILNLSFAGVRGETLLHGLESEEIYVSTGSACSSHKQRISPVLAAHGVPEALAAGALRFSLSPMNTLEEMEKTAQALQRQVSRLRRFGRKR